MTLDQDLYLQLETKSYHGRLEEAQRNPAFRRYFQQRKRWAKCHLAIGALRDKLKRLETLERKEWAAMTILERNVPQAIRDWKL